MRMPARGWSLGLTVAILAGAAGPVAAQQFPTFAGGELRAGAVLPDAADRTWGLGFDADLGEILPQLRVFAGYHGFGANVRRVVREEALTGDIRGHGARFGTRYEIRAGERFSPYLAAAAAAYWASGTAVEASDQGLMEDLYQGGHIGTTLGAGMSYPLEETGQVLVMGEFRRTFMGTIRHWALDAGLRLELREDDVDGPR